jgi:hypothetical protein
LTGSNCLGSVEDVFRQLSESISQFAGLSLSRIGDLGVKMMVTPEDSTSPMPPGEPVDEEIIELPALHATK